MSPIDLIKSLDHRTAYERLAIIIECLKKLDVNFIAHKYATGTNLIVDIGKPTLKIGISSHFDVAKGAGGANDNSTAIAVCLDIIRKFQVLNDLSIGLRIFFFDEEENGLFGSTAYVKGRGTKDMIGLINLELVGIGNKVALWPVHAQHSGPLLKAFEVVARENKIVSQRFDQIITNTADHVPFRKAGLFDSFTVTCVSETDLEVALRYYKALELGAGKQTLFEILSKAPIFEHYHQSTDTFDKINVDSIEMISRLVWETILKMSNVTSR